MFHTSFSLESPSPLHYDSHDYNYYDHMHGTDVNRKTIDGHITGCGRCVGYCKYNGHPGFLTSEQRKKHDCIKKGCHYYISKPARMKPTITIVNIIDLVAPIMSAYEGMRILHAEQGNDSVWHCYYITITNAYSEQTIEETLCEQLFHPIKLKRLNYDYETCAELLMRV